MSTYTTTIWEIIKSLNNYEPDEPNKLIEKYRNKIFNFDYSVPETINKDNFKKWFETTFIMHFGTWEIGCDTFGLFQMRLQAKCYEIMPIYNKMIDNLNSISPNDFRHGQYGTVKRNNKSQGESEETNDSMGSTLPVNMINSNAISDVNYADSASKSESQNTNKNTFEEEAKYDLTYFTDIIGLLNYNEKGRKIYTELFDEFNILFLGVM